MNAETTAATGTAQRTPVPRDLPPPDRAPGFPRALRYEWTAFRTLRSNWALLGTALVLQVLVTVLAHHSGDSGQLVFKKALSVTTVLGILVAATGVNAFGLEYRRRTIVTTVLTLRSRRHVLLAKTVTAGVVALVAEAVLAAASWSTDAVLFGTPPENISETLATGAGAVVYVALCSLVGLALAGILRGSALPIALLAIWPEVELLLVDRLNLPPALQHAVEPFSSARFATTTHWSMVLPLLVLAVVLLIGAGVSLTRRDA